MKKVRESYPRIVVIETVSRLGSSLRQHKNGREAKKLWLRLDGQLDNI